MSRLTAHVDMLPFLQGDMPCRRLKDSTHWTRVVQLRCRLEIFLHAAASFVVTPIGWAVRDPSANITADLFIGVIHLFRMPVFFLLSGFFARLLYVRLGIGGFVLHRRAADCRSARVALPLLSPALDALWRWGGVRNPRICAGPGDALPRFDMGAAWCRHWPTSGFSTIWLYCSRLSLASSGCSIIH